jgi:phenylacetate-CoA ligase
VIVDPTRAVGQKLARTERLSCCELRVYQAPLMAKLLAHARENTDFYKDQLDFDLASRESIETAWAKIPILTRAQAVANKERLKSRRMPAGSGEILEMQTSGSTGMPFRFQRTTNSEVIARALTERMFRWWRVDGNKSLAQIFFDRSESGAPRSIPGRGWHSARPNGLRYLLSHTFNIDALLDWLVDHKPDYFGAYSSILKGLAVTAEQHGTQLKFDLLFSFAAVVDQDIRALCRSVFASEIADTYGSQEVGHIAAQCPDCGDYHISGEACFLEILRADGSSAAPGEIGRVVVTPFYSYAMPFIRYELGDLAEAGTTEPSCCRKLATLRRILGRYRNLFRFRDGTSIWPVPSWFGRFIALKQFQVVQTAFDHIEIRYVPESADQTIDLPALTQHVQTMLRQPVNVTVHAVEAIERSRSGKYEDFISLVPERDHVSDGDLSGQ